MTPADELSSAKCRDMSRLRWERVRRGLTIRDVVAELGISSTSVLAYWETGDTTPGFDAAVRIATFYGLPVEELFSRPERGTGVTVATTLARRGVTA